MFQISNFTHDKSKGIIDFDVEYQGETNHAKIWMTDEDDICSARGETELNTEEWDDEVVSGAFEAFWEVCMDIVSLDC